MVPVHIVTSFNLLTALYLLCTLPVRPAFYHKTDRPLVRVKQGILVGRMQHSLRDNSPYYSFVGIPYAKPPVGNLRFKAPEPPDFWFGIRPAIKPGPMCSQKNKVDFKLNEESNENCLFLNVFTPEMRSKPKTKLPVMFFMHGGALILGSSDPKVYGPDFLMPKKIVLVTINYRLGALGFLSLQNSLVPGNNGLKDLVMALKWVQENIEQFGGDPTQVTIFGQSAGAALTHLLTLSPLTKNLFKKAIFMSGGACPKWAYHGKPRVLAYELGKSVGYLGNNDEELLEVLRNASTPDLVLNSFLIYSKVQPLDTYYNFMPFTPTWEAKSPEAFLTAHPCELIRSRKTADVPIMLGTTTLEGLMVYLARNTSRDIVEMNTLVTRVLHLPITKRLPDEILNKIQNFYFPRGSYDVNDHLKLLSYVGFEKDTIDLIETLRNDNQRKSPTFIYKFCHEGEADVMNKEAQVLYHLKSKFPGVAHGGELGYIFNVENVSLDAMDNLTMHWMTKAWTDFAWAGDPWPEEPRKTVNFNYIEIDTDFKLREDFLLEERELWGSIELPKNL